MADLFTESPIAALSAEEATAHHQRVIESHQFDRCIQVGGHDWHPADPGDNFWCRRCGFVGARNWPSFDECSD